MRIAFHAINGVGLGHLVRSVSIAREVRSLHPDASLLVLTTARDVSLLEREGLDFVRFPARLSEPHAEPGRAPAALPDDLHCAAALAALEAFAPDLVVFDTHAPPALVEGATALGARTALVLRELRPDALAAWLRGPSPAGFDRIVVPHEPDEVDLAAAPADVPIEVVGPIVRGGEPGAAPPALPPGDGPLVVVAAGGGGQPVDAARFLRAAADAHVLARLRVAGLRTAIIAGPYAGAVDLPTVDGLAVLRAVAYPPALLARADLVVSQAGYNAVAEIRALRKPAVLVPGRRKLEDQRARARRLVRAGAALIARPEARAIADGIEEALPRAAAMAAAHARRPLLPRNREAALAILRPVRAPDGPVRRVVLVAHDFPPRRGGMEVVARELAAGLARAGVEPVVYTTQRLGPCAAPGATVRPLFTALRPPGVIDLVGDLPLAIAAIEKDAPDVVHLCHAGLAPWVPAIRAAWPCRVTVSVHGNDLLAPWVHPGGDDASYRSALRAGLEAADAVLPVSAFTEGLVRDVAPRARVERVRNGVDADRFRPGPPDAALAARLGIEPGDELIVTISRLAPRKGHATVLRALAAVLRARPRARWAFTGAGDALLGPLLETARRLGVERRVLPLGFLRDEDLPGLLRLARVFVLVPDGEPAAAGRRDVEGFGIAFLEAAATALPAVGSTADGVPEAVIDGATGLLVPPGDADRTAAAIVRLLADADLARRLGEAARARAAAELAWDRICARYLEVFARTGGAAPAAPDPGDATGLRALLAGEPSSPYPRVLALREALRAVGTAAGLARLARGEAAARRAEAERRREATSRAIARGRTLKLRATGEGLALLPGALADCAALGHRPDLELTLRTFLDPDARPLLLAAAHAIALHQGVPGAAPRSVIERVSALAAEDLRPVRSLRIHLAPAARESHAAAVACVPEVHALREAFARRGVPVLPPPELARYLSTTPAGGPETAMIEPTNRCNLACPTCPTGTGKIRPLPDMSLERFDRALTALAPPRLRNLALWNYGEPTLNKALPQMIARAKRRGVGVVKVSSNVHFLDGDRGAALLESGLDVLILSVDGASPETYRRFRQNGDFAKVASAVRALCDEKRRRGLERPAIELQFIAMRHNEHEVPEIRRLAADWGVDRLRIKTFGADDAENRRLIPLAPGLSRFAADGATPNVSHPFCTMAWDHAVINVDGAVTPCCYLRPDMGPEFVMGNAFETPFVEIWRGGRYRAFRARMLADRGSMPVCAGCRGGTHDLLAAVEEVPAAAAPEAASP